MSKNPDTTERLYNLNRKFAKKSEELLKEYTKMDDKRLPMYEAELELDLKVIDNEIRQLQGQTPVYVERVQPDLYRQEGT